MRLSTRRMRHSEIKVVNGDLSNNSDIQTFMIHYCQLIQTISPVTAFKEASEHVTLLHNDSVRENSE